MRLQTLKGQRGLSLIEVTIMLLVLMLLTSVLAPSIFDFVTDAQWVKVKEDCEVLAISVARLVKDVGPRLIDRPGGDYPDDKLDLIVSDGRPAEDAPPDIGPGWGDGRVNWWTISDNPNPVVEDGISTCDEQFITNQYGGSQFYPEASGPPVGLAWGQGWRGAYLSPPCGPDPWGYAYQINVKWLTTRFDFGRHSNKKDRPHCIDVFCLSPGKNGIIETPFGPRDRHSGSGTYRHGDDWVTVIAPCDP